MEEDKLGGKERWQQMITVILVSHGGMAKGMVESTTMLIGEQPDLAFITFEPGDGVEDLTAKVEEKLKEALAGGEAIVMTDIPNGTPFNCVSRLMEHYRFRHLTGMNLPMVVDVVSQLGEDASAEQLCEGTLKPSREAMIDVNAWMKELGILE